MPCLNILAVFTGGTIGSTAINGSIKPDSSKRYKLLDLFEKAYPSSNNLCFKTIQPVQILSENLFPSVWETLIEAIETEDISHFDGIIITHGTDTLAYTAAALSLYFNSTPIPILLVSSDTPLDTPQANGLLNFHCAIEFIKQRKEAGVFVPYKNQNTKTLIHLGTHVASSLQVSSDFLSVQSKAYLSFEENAFHQQNVIFSPDRTPVQLIAHFSTQILLIRPYPGLDYSQYNLDQVDVVLHDLYHSGTACTSTDWGGNHSLLQFIEKCHHKNLAFYMTPAIKNTDTYDSTRLLIKQGAQMIWNMSLESSYTKLLLAYGNFTTTENINQFLEQNIAFEHILHATTDADF